MTGSEKTANVGRNAERTAFCGRSAPPPTPESRCDICTAPIAAKRLRRGARRCSRECGFEARRRSAARRYKPVPLEVQAWNLVVRGLRMLARNEGGEPGPGGGA